jgi:hypothetical protein
MSNEKQKILTFVLIGVSMLLALVGAFYGVRLPYPELPTVDEQLQALAGSRGITGDLSGDIRVEDDLAVGGALTVAGATYLGGNIVIEGATADDYETTITATDPTADRTITIGDDTGSVMLTSTPGVFVFGNNVVTGTHLISHGLTTPQTAFCTLGANSAAASNVCTIAVVTSTATISVWKNDGTTAGDAGVLVHWIVAGQQ